MNDETLDKYHRMVEVVRLLASDAGTQIGAFREMANVTDEMAILYFDVYRYVELLHEHSMISHAAKVLLDEINLHFKKMTKMLELWSNEGLTSDAEWEKMRDLARNVLEELKENLQNPRLYWVHFAQSR